MGGRRASDDALPSRGLFGGGGILFGGGWLCVNRRTREPRRLVGDGVLLGGWAAALGRTTSSRNAALVLGAAACLWGVVGCANNQSRWARYDVPGDGEASGGGLGRGGRGGEVRQRGGKECMKRLSHQGSRRRGDITTMITASSFKKTTIN